MICAWEGSLSNESPVLPSLLIHDGELSDVAELLERLGLEHIERRGCASAEDQTTSWELVVATPKRLLEFDLVGLHERVTPDRAAKQAGFGSGAVCAVAKTVVVDLDADPIVA